MQWRTASASDFSTAGDEGAEDAGVEVVEEVEGMDAAGRLRRVD